MTPLSKAFVSGFADGVATGLNKSLPQLILSAIGAIICVGSSWHHVGSAFMGLAFGMQINVLLRFLRNGGAS
jgi:hypothetical protein